MIIPGMKTAATTAAVAAVAALVGLSLPQTALAAQKPLFASTGLDNCAGRFLHITDIHPDQYYTVGAKINDACHSTDALDAERKKKKKKKKKLTSRAGYWGAPVSVCDSPKRLVTATFDWIARNWAEEEDEANKADAKTATAAAAFDFIIWTGDTARHDIDFTHPRKAEEIFDYNRWALHMLETRFPGTPIVPNIGNNDIIPHNIMFPGPNSMTRAFRDIWATHIPADQEEHFLDGGYFSVEVIPNDLAVLSLNTLYWYDNNAATRGCKKASEPGSRHLDWLADELGALRQRGLQAHLIGHVPPTAGNYFGNCYDQYTDIVLRFQDTIVGQHFGHMNIDAMFLQEDFSIATRDVNEKQHEVVGIRSLASDLRKEYDFVPTHQKTNLDAYLAFFAAPSVVPTYFPTVRVWTYNNTRPLVESRKERATGFSTSFFNQTAASSNDDEMMTTSSSTLIPPPPPPPPPQKKPLLSVFQRSHRRPKHHKHKNHRKIQRHVAPDSPSRTNQYRTLLGYSQWVLDLPRVNKEFSHDEKEKERQIEYQLEYTTYDEKTLWTDYLPHPSTHVHRPVPKRLLDREIARRKTRAPSTIAGSTTFRHSPPIHVPSPLQRLTAYRLPSFTIEHILDFARDLAGDDRVWSLFQARIYTESGFQE